MKHYYHLTTFENAQLIQKYGFKPGERGNLGPGMYFAFNPQHTMIKAQCKKKETIIVVMLNVGRLNTVLRRHSGWTLKSVKNHGYDSVQKLNCKTGPEICIYETHRITIVGFVIWNKSYIKFMNIHGYKIDESQFTFLTNGRKTFTNNIDNMCPIDRNFYDNSKAQELYERQKRRRKFGSLIF